MLFKRYTSLLISTSIFVQSVSPAFAMDTDPVVPKVRMKPKKSLLDRDETTEPSLQQIKITKIKNISEMDQTAGMVAQPGDMIFFDIDNTLLKRRKDSNEDILNLDPKVADMVKNWQALNKDELKPERHITIILLTARDPDEEKTTRKELKVIGFPEDIEIIFAPNDRQAEGKIPTKGRYALKRIDEAKIKPRRIIVIDDLEENLKDINHTFQQANTYKKIPLKLLQRETQNKIYESPDTEVEFPQQLTNLTYVKHLSGGSGGVHVLKDTKGKFFTFKSTENSEHMKEEILADALYRSLGVKVPAFAIYDYLPEIEEVKQACTGPGPYRLSPFLEADETASDEVRVQALRKHFVADALFSNLDIVIGGFKNVLIDKEGTLWRIDNGGSLRFRALGESKFGLKNWDMHEVRELTSMRDTEQNAAGAQVYDSLTENDLKEQVSEILKKSPALFSTLDDITKKIHLTNPSEVREMLRRRLDDLVKKYFLTPSCSSSQIFDGFEALNFGAGILPCSIDPETSKKVILLGKRIRHNWWCNPGGKSDLDIGPDSDKTLAHTAVRETQEESLGNLSFTPQELAQVPSHTIVNKDDVLYRMYMAHHPYVPIEQLKNARTVKDYGWEPEYTDYRWVPLDEFLLGIEQNYLVEEESRKTLKIGDMIIYPPFFEMLSQGPVKSALRSIYDGKKIRVKHTYDKEVVIRISTPLSLEEEKGQLAETLVKKGLVLGQIKANDKAIQSKALLPPEAVEHSEDVQKMAGFLPDPEAKALREQLLQTPYTQTEAHLRAVMGQEVFDSLQGDSEKEVNVFLQNHSQFENLRSEFLTDSHYKKNLAQALDKEKENKDKAVFCTATDPLTCLIWDIISAHRSQLKNRGASSLIAMRGLEEKFASILDVEAFIKTYREETKKVNNYATVNDIHYADLGLSVNPFLFGNDGKPTSATYSLFYKVDSLVPTQQEQLFNAFMATTGIPGKFQDYKALFQQYYLCNNKENSKLFQIFVDPQVVDSAAYMAVSGGDVLTVKMDDESPYHGFAKILPELCTTPEKFAERIGGRSTGKLGATLTLNNLQGRLFLKPEIFLDPKYVNIKTYWRHPMSKERETSYKQKLNAQVLQDLSSWLTQACSLLNNKTFIEGTPALKKSYLYAYNDIIALPYIEKEPSSLLPTLIKDGNFQYLKEILEKNPNIDINARFQNTIYREGGRAIKFALEFLTPQTPNVFEIVSILVGKGLKTLEVPNMSDDLRCNLLDKLLPHRQSLSPEIAKSFDCLWNQEKQKSISEIAELVDDGYLTLCSSLLLAIKEEHIGTISPSSFQKLFSVLKNFDCIKFLKIPNSRFPILLKSLLSSTKNECKKISWYQTICKELVAQGNDYWKAKDFLNLSSCMNFLISSGGEIYKEHLFDEAIVKAPDDVINTALKEKHRAVLGSILEHATREIEWNKVALPNLEAWLPDLLKMFEDNLPFKNKHLNLSGLCLRKFQKPLLTFLKNNTTVTSLNLKECTLRERNEDLSNLAEALKANTTLQRLSLSGIALVDVMCHLSLNEQFFHQNPWYKSAWNEYISSPVQIVQQAICNAADIRRWNTISRIIKDVKPDVLDLRAYSSFLYPQNEFVQALIEGLKDNTNLKDLNLPTAVVEVFETNLKTLSPGPFSTAPWFIKAKQQIIEDDS